MPVAPKTEKDTATRSAGCIEKICTSHDLDREAETSETSEVMMCPPLSPSLLWCRFGTTKRYALLQHAVENGKHLMRYSHDGAFLPTSRRQLLKSCLEYGALLSGCRPRALHQSRTQVWVSVRRLATLPNACAFSIARTEPRPTGYLFDSGEWGQVYAGLGQNRGCCQLSDTRNCL